MRGDLDWIVMKALEKDRTRRYETANGLARDMQRYLANEPVEACPPSATYRLRKFARRNRVVITTGALVSSVLVLGLVVSAWQAIRATRAEHRAEAARVNEAEQRQVAESQRSEAQASRAKATEEAKRAVVEAEKAQQVARFMTKMFEESAPLEMAGMRLAASDKAGASANLTAQEILDRGTERITSELKEQPLIQAALKDTMGNVYLGLGKMERAETLLQEAYDLRQRNLPREHLDMASSLHSIGILRTLQRRYADGAAALREAMQTRRKLLGDDHELVDKSRWMLATILIISKPGGAEHDVPEALELERETLAWHRSHLGNSHIETAFSMLGLATALLETAATDQSANAEAAQLILEATPLLLRDERTKPIGLAISHLQEAILAERTIREQTNASGVAAQIDAAIAAAKKAVATARESTSRDHPYVLGIATEANVVLGNLANLQSRRGALKQAEGLYRETLQAAEAIHRANPAIEPQRLPRNMRDLAFCLKRQGDSKEADDLERQALAMLEKLVVDQPNIPNARVELGYALSDSAVHLATLGKNAEAETAHRRAADVFARLAAEFPTSRFYQRQQFAFGRRLASFLRNVGQHRKAEESYRQVLALHAKLADELASDERYQSDHSQLEGELTDVLLAQGKRDEADKVFQRAAEASKKNANQLNALVWPLAASASAKMSNYVQVLALAKQANELAPKNASLLNTLGLAHYRAGQWKETVDALRQSQDLSGVLYAGANGYFLAMTYARLDQTEAARRWFDAADRWTAVFAPTDPELLGFRAEAAGILKLTLEPLVAVPNTPENAEKVVSLTAEADPDAAWVPGWRGQSAANSGAWAEAAEQFTKAATLNGDNMQIHSWAALARLQLGDLAGYRSTCAAAIERAGKVAPPLTNLWLVWTCAVGPDAVSDWDVPLSRAQQLIDSAPPHADYLTVLGALLYRAGRFDEATKRLTEANAAFAKTKTATMSPAYGQFFLAMAQHRLNHPQEARRALEQARALVETTPQATLVWNRRLAFDLFDREAAALIQGDPEAASP